MELRRPLLAILLLATALQAAGMAQVPAAGPGRPEVHPDRPRVRPSAVRRRRPPRRPAPALSGADRPGPSAVAVVLGDGPASWRIAAQVVSLLAFLLAVAGSTASPASRPAIGRPTSRRCSCVLLPIPAKLGHDTLSDATALARLRLGDGLGARCGLDASARAGDRGRDRDRPRLLGTPRGRPAAGDPGRRRDRGRGARPPPVAGRRAAGAALRVGLAVALPFAASLAGYAATKGTSPRSSPSAGPRTSTARPARLRGGPRPAAGPRRSPLGLLAEGGIGRPRPARPRRGGPAGGRLTLRGDGLGPAAPRGPRPIAGGGRRGGSSSPMRPSSWRCVVRHAMTLGYLSSRHP